MPRPSKKKQVSSLPLYSCFTHTDQLSEDNYIKMSIEEFETIRLIDYLGKQQQECAEMMEISRASIQMLYDAARKKNRTFSCGRTSSVFRWWQLSTKPETDIRR